jgi:hypothetical protein
MNHYKNSVKRTQHFITALLATVLIGNTPHALAQDITPNTSNQCTAFGLTPMPNGFVGFGTSYWNYLPNDKDALSRHTLNFSTEEPRMLIEQDAIIKTHLPSTVSPPIISDDKAFNEYTNLFLKNTDSTQSDAFFYTARIKAVKSTRYQYPLGHTVEITGFAYVIDIEQDDSHSEKAVTLRVGMLTSELSKEDKLIPHHCYFSSPQNELPTTSQPQATTAKIIAPIGAAYFIHNTNQSNVVLIDKGSNAGLMAGQYGTLTDNTLSTQARRKPAAQVRLLRVYANHSVAAVTDTAAEIATGQTIQLSNKLNHQPNEK